MRNILKIMTPENIEVEMELAGMGSRCVATVIDTLLQVGLLAVLALMMLIAGVPVQSWKGLSTTMTTLGIILLFVIIFGYHIFFEMLLNGQTPGKMAAKLRVVTETGEPVRFIASFTRNILRIADLLPSFYLAGAISILFSAHYKRIGDFAANTIVVKVQHRKTKVALYALVQKYAAGSAPSEHAGRYPLTTKEYGVLKEYMQRRADLGARQPVFEYHLRQYFVRKFGIEPIGDTHQFFEELLQANQK